MSVEPPEIGVAPPRPVASHHEATAKCEGRSIVKRGGEGIMHARREGGHWQILKGEREREDGLFAIVKLLSSQR